METSGVEERKTLPWLPSEDSDSSSGVAVNTTSCDDNKAMNSFHFVQGLHSKVFESAVVRAVDPLRCLSIRKLRSRSICQWGIWMIKKTILGQRNSGSLVKGFVTTGKFSVLVQIPDECSEIVVQHFIYEGKSKEVANSLATEGPWYHVVDGGHLHAALVELIEDFSISRIYHEMQRDAHLLDYTLPDAMQNLRDIVDRNCRRQGITLTPGEKVRSGFIKEVMAEYAGRPGYADNTMRNICGIVVKLSSDVVHTIRLLLTEECDVYCEQLGPRRTFGDDTRVYKKLLSSQSLKGVKLFLGGAIHDMDKINVIHRLRFLAREREYFRSFPPSEVERQCKNVNAARQEVSKFQEFLDGEAWPTEMKNLQRNMFRTTLMDREILEHNADAKKDLLPPLAESYIRATGLHGSQKLGMYKKQLQMVGHDIVQSRIAGHGEIPTIAHEVREEDVDDLNVSETKKSGKACGNDGSTHDPEKFLQDYGVFLKRTSLLEFERNSSDLERSFDFILADPFQKIPCPRNDSNTLASGGSDTLLDEKGIKLCLQCIRRLLVPGGYLFIFLNWKQLAQWTMLSMECMLETICDPFLVIKDDSKVQKMTTKGLQSLYEPELVLRKPGKHPKGFTADKASPYENLPGCKMPRWCNIIDGVTPPLERLTFKPTKVFVRPTEKSCSLFIELMRTFYPQDGMVLDPCAGALTTDLACIGTKRSCVLLETDGNCLSQALPRLVAFAKSQLHTSASKSTSSEETCGPQSSEKDVQKGRKVVDQFSDCEETSEAVRSWMSRSDSENDVGKAVKRPSPQMKCRHIDSSEEEKSLREKDSDYSTDIPQNKRIDDKRGYKSKKCERECSDSTTRALQCVVNLTARVANGMKRSRPST